MSRIVYNKERSGKIVSGRGPKDNQDRVELAKQQGLLHKMTPSVQAAEVDAPTFVGASQSLSLDVVRQKIEEAVAFTRKVEADRYESGIRNLNDQLNSAKNHLEE